MNNYKTEILSNKAKLILAPIQGAKGNQEYLMYLTGTANVT